MDKSQKILLGINAALLLGFGGVFVARGNYEFVIYVGVIVFFMGVVGATLRRVRYSLASLVGLTVWSAMHLAGGGIAIELAADGGGDPGVGRLYDVMLVPLSDTLPIFRYDQLVHIWGFGAATLVMHDLLAGSLRQPVTSRFAVPLVVVMAGLGVGAFNEIVEFGVAGLVPQSGVGGYMNTSLDLVADLVGAVLGLVWLRVARNRAPVAVGGG